MSESTSIRPPNELMVQLDGSGALVGRRWSISQLTQLTVYEENGLCTYQQDTHSHSSDGGIQRPKFLTCQQCLDGLDGERLCSLMVKLYLAR